MTNIGKEYCYEYFDCKEQNCIRRKNLDVNCWEIDDVKCQTHSEEFEKLKNMLGSKIEACKYCIYYRGKNEL